MKMSAAFPSEYLRAADLDDKPALFVMDHVKMMDVGDDHKPVLFFQQHDKGLVLNKTNANTISGLYGDDSDEWSGREIVLFPTMVDFQGRSVEAIRVRAPKKKAAPPQPKPAPAEDRGARIDDEIPF